MLVRWQSTVVDQRGNVLPGATIRVLFEETQEPAEIYQDDEGLRPWPGGVVTADQNGFVFFCAAEGLYRIKSDQAAIDWRKVPLVAPARGAAEAASTAFIKADSGAAAFVKTGPGSVSLKAGTKVGVAGALVAFVQDTPIAMPELRPGIDYAVWVKDDATIVATESFAAPPDAGAWRKIGGFHFALGGNAPGLSTGGDDVPAINEYSFWDLKFRPACSDPRGMTLVAGSFWADIYLTGVDHHINGTSRYNVVIANTINPPRIPLAFGGNGTVVYSPFNWWAANEVLISHGKRCPTYAEFSALAFGTTEGQTAGGSEMDQGTNRTGVNPAGYSNPWHWFTSRWGVIQATGLKYTFGADIFGTGGAGTWENVSGGRGGTKPTPKVGAFGGTTNSGSRNSSWDYTVATSNVAQLSARGVCDHLIIW